MSLVLCMWSLFATKQAPENVQVITARNSNTIEQVITEKLIIPCVMVGPHYVNLIKVQRFDELDPREASEEQHRELVEDLVEESLYEEEPSKTCKIGSALTRQLREELI